MKKKKKKKKTKTVPNSLGSEVWASVFGVFKFKFLLIFFKK